MQGGNISNPNGVGGFHPGQSGNPGGRPQSVSAIQLAARRYGLEAIETLATLLRTGGPEALPSIQIAAARELLDRGFGRPAQAIDLAVNAKKQISEMTLDELAAVERTLLAASPMMIEEARQESLLDRLEGGNGGDGRVSLLDRMEGANGANDE